MTAPSGKEKSRPGRLAQDGHHRAAALATRTQGSVPVVPRQSDKHLLTGCLDIERKALRAGRIVVTAVIQIEGPSYRLRDAGSRRRMISVAQNQPVCPSAQEEMRAIQNQPARPSAPNWDGPVQDQPLAPLGWEAGTEEEA